MLRRFYTPSFVVARGSTTAIAASAATSSSFIIKHPHEAFRFTATHHHHQQQVNWMKMMNIMMKKESSEIIIPSQVQQVRWFHRQSSTSSSSSSSTSPPKRTKGAAAFAGIEHKQLIGVLEKLQIESGGIELIRFHRLTGDTFAKNLPCDQIQEFPHLKDIYELATTEISSMSQVHVNKLLDILRLTQVPALPVLECLPRDDIMYLDLSNLAGIEDINKLHSFLIDRRDALKRVNLENLEKIPIAYRTIVPQLISQPYLRSLSLAGLHETTQDVLELLVQFSAAFEKVNLSYCNQLNSDIFQLLTKLPYLSNLNLSNCNGIKDITVLHNFLINRKDRLKYFAIWGFHVPIPQSYRVGVSRYFSEPESRKTLDLSATADVTADVVALLLQFSSHSVTSINLGSAPLLTKDGFRYLMEKVIEFEEFVVSQSILMNDDAFAKLPWPKNTLKELTIDVNRSITGSFLADLPATNRLKKLDLSFCSVKDEHAANVGRFGETLEELYLSENRMISGSFLSKQALPKLKTLHLNGCKLNDDALHHIASNAPAVETLNICRNDAVSETAVVELVGKLKNLQWLYVSNLSNEKQQQLKEINPKLEIYLA